MGSDGVTRGCKMPWPALTRPSRASKRGRVKVWAILPITPLAAPLGMRVRASSVLQREAGGGAVMLIETGNTFGGACQQQGIVRRGFGGRVGPVRQKRET